MRSRALVLLLALTACAKAPAAAPPAARTPSLTAEAATPLYRNLYLQNADLTTHVVVRSGEDGRMGRIVVADPRGNTGVGLWSERLATTGTRGLVVEGALREVTNAEGIHGVAVTLTGPTELRFRKYLLGNVRELRDAEQDAGAPRDALLARASEVLGAWGTQADAGTEQTRQTMLRRLAQWQRHEVVVGPSGTVVLAREALGSGARYRVELVPAAGTKLAVEDGVIVVKGEGRSSFEVRTFLDRPRLAPLERLFKEGDGGAMGESLRFLASGEKLLAGSWQYLTYFGRDTMISAALLSGRATPDFLAMAVGSVLDRVSPEGIPAHEEDIGDQATLRNLGPLLDRIRATPRTKLGEADLVALEKPVFDTKMIDGEFLLPQLVERLVASAPAGDPAVARALRADRLAALARVLGRIDTLTARAPTRTTFVAFNEGEKVGDWRDSHEGNGLGHVPLDVSAYLVPAALESIASLAKSPAFPRDTLLAQAGPDRARLAKMLDAKVLLARRDAWRKASRDAFAIGIDRATARKRLGVALATLDRDEADAFLAQPLLGTKTTLREALEPGSEALGGKDGRVKFSGIALDDKDQPIPVQSSDAIFDLFYGTPTREDVLAHAETLFQPYPLGLMTPVGVATSNAAFSDRPQDRDLFGKGKYHGSKVVWGWQQPMLKQGLARQQARFKDDAEVTRVLAEASALAETAAANVGAVGTKAEAWAWTTKDAKIRAVPYGADAGDATEANDRQLWTIAGSLGANR